MVNEPVSAAASRAEEQALVEVEVRRAHCPAFGVDADNFI